MGVVLSSGYFGFYGHAGFVAALREAKIVAHGWAGASAGGLVAAFAASDMTTQSIKALLLARTKADFWDPTPLASAWAFFAGGPAASGLLRGERFAATLRAALPCQTFETLPTPLVIVATDLQAQAPSVIRTGDLASAVHATCAYPGLFQAVEREGTLLWDGGLVDKAPVAALAHAHPEIEVILVHLLPSAPRSSTPSGALAYVQGMAAGIAALRSENMALQVQLMQARGTEVHVFADVLPKVTPDTMSQGRVAYEAALSATNTWLAGA